MNPDEARFHRIHASAIALIGPSATTDHLIRTMNAIAEIDQKQTAGI